MSRKRWISVAALLAILLAGEFCYWRVAANRLRSEFNTWVAVARAAGWDIKYGAIESGGWPNTAVLSVQSLTIASGPEVPGRDAVTIGGVSPRGMAWSAETVLLRAELTRPGVVALSPVGRYSLWFNRGPPITVSADDLLLRLNLGTSALPTAMTFDANSLVASVPEHGQFTVGHLSGNFTLTPGTGSESASLGFSVSARLMTLPDGILRGASPDANALAFEGVLNGLRPFERSAARQNLAARATSWRDEGGSLELHRVMVDWSPTRLEATATLALDEELQPMGAGTSKIVGYGPALDALATNAVITRSAAKAAKAVLTLLAHTQTDDKSDEVEVPLALQFRTLSVRQVPLIRLPEFDWPTDE